MEPIEVLRIELQKYKSALLHLEDALEKKQISKDLHDSRKDNITLKINSFRHAIETLQIFG